MMTGNEEKDILIEEKKMSKKWIKLLVIILIESHLYLYLLQ